MRSLVLTILLCAACGGAQHKTTTPGGGTSPTAADPAVPQDCDAACARATECNQAPPDDKATCQAACEAARGDDATRSRWACWGSAKTCDELSECTATGEAP